MPFFKEPPLWILSAILLGAFLFFFDDPSLGHLVWGLTLVLGGLPIVYRTLKGMCRGQFASDIVAMLAIITAFLLNEAFAGAIVVLMQSGGEAIERYGFRKASASLEELFKRAPRKARRKRALLEEIDVDEVEIHDVLVVLPGEMIPVDGEILQGSSEIDESALTGEPWPQEKHERDLLFSGSINIRSPFEMRALKRSSDSQYAKIVQLVQKAQEEKAPIQRLADRYAIFFTPLTLVMALLGYLLTNDFVVSLAVLVVATPCPLILATPLAVICAINQAAKEGIIVKGGSPIEQIANAKAVLFDKTGTLTKGSPTIESITAFGEESKENILYFAASLEQFSTHSIAKAITKEGLKQFKTLPFPKNFQETPGKGVAGEIEGRTYSLFGTSQGAISLLQDNIPIGELVLKDPIRPHVRELIDKLSSLGIQEIMMITGDCQKSAELIAKQANISLFEANLMPEQKVLIVERFKKKYSSLVMVGDGINDAPALATATVGIAMGAYGTAISAEAANIVFLVDDLSKVATAIEIGKRMLFIAKQSIFIGIGLSFLLMVIALSGKISPPFGALFQEVIDVTVILNALRVLKK